MLKWKASVTVRGTSRSLYFTKIQSSTCLTGKVSWKVKNSEEFRSKLQLLLHFTTESQFALKTDLSSASLILSTEAKVKRRRSSWDSLVIRCGHQKDSFLHVSQKVFHLCTPRLVVWTNLRCASTRITFHSVQMILGLLQLLTTILW